MASKRCHSSVALLEKEQKNGFKEGERNIKQRVSFPFFFFCQTSICFSSRGEESDARRLASTCISPPTPTPSHFSDPLPTILPAFHHGLPPACHSAPVCSLAPLTMLVCAVCAILLLASHAFLKLMSYNSYCCRLGWHIRDKTVITAICDYTTILKNSLLIG